MSVTDWKKFDWSKYSNESRSILSRLLSEWKHSQDSPGKMAKDLIDSLDGLAEDISMKKVVSRHSRPWINKDLSSMLSDLREMRKKFKKHRRPIKTF